MEAATHDAIIDQIPHLRRYARALTRNPVDADDLVQECLLRAVDRLHLWTPGSNMRTWLFTIMHNQFINQARRQNIRPDDAPLEDGDGAAVQPASQESEAAVRDLGDALANLPEDQRQAVLLVGLEGFSYREVAEIVDAPIGTVMSRLNRGRQKLRELIELSNTTSLRRVK